VTDPVMITGLGVVCSTGHDPKSFEAALRAGTCGIRPAGDQDRPGFAAPIRDFAPADAFAGLGIAASLRERAHRVTVHSPWPVRVATVAALQAWAGAGLQHACPAGDRLGVVIGGSNLTGRYADDLRPRHNRNPAYLPGSFALHALDTDHVGTLSEVLGITGEGCTVGGASASGNLAIIHAARLVGCGFLDACLAVGALADLSAMERSGFVNLGAMAAGAPGRRRSAPFDTGHAGFVPGEGAACLVLESGRSARRRGAPALAELAGYGLRLDASRLAAPSERGEAQVIASAMGQAGLSGRDIGYVNAHGSASPLGDRTEAAALARAFGADVCLPWVNSTKGLVGHCLSAAGVVEAVATVLQMRGGFVHPNAGLAEPVDRRCRFAGPAACRAEITFALSNGFGFGGLNSCIALAQPAR
jgi:malonyl-ACP decarboxylase